MFLSVPKEFPRGSLAVPLDSLVVPCVLIGFCCVFLGYSLDMHLGVPWVFLSVLGMFPMPSLSASSF